MPALPPVPDDVLHVELTFDVNGREYRNGWWWLVPDLAVGGIPWLVATMSNIFADLVFPVTGLMHAGGSWTTCRLASGGNAPLVYVEAAPLNHGAHTGGQADAIATGVYVVTLASRRGSGSRIRFPACPDDAVQDNWLLSAAGLARCFDFAAALNSLTSSLVAPTGAQVLLGTLQRRTAAGPRAVSSFDPATAVLPSFRVEVLARRMPRSRGISP